MSLVGSTPTYPVVSLHPEHTAGSGCAVWGAMRAVAPPARRGTGVELAHALARRSPGGVTVAVPDRYSARRSLGWVCGLVKHGESDSVVCSTFVLRTLGRGALFFYFICGAEKSREVEKVLDDSLCPMPFGDRGFAGDSPCSSSPAARRTSSKPQSQTRRASPAYTPTQANVEQSNGRGTSAVTPPGKRRASE